MKKAMEQGIAIYFLNNGESKEDTDYEKYKDTGAVIINLGKVVEKEVFIEVTGVESFKRFDKYSEDYYRNVDAYYDSISGFEVYGNIYAISKIDSFLNDYVEENYFEVKKEANYKGEYVHIKGDANVGRTYISPERMANFLTSEILESNPRVRAEIEEKHDRGPLEFIKHFSETGFIDSRVLYEAKSYRHDDQNDKTCKVVEALYKNYKKYASDKIELRDFFTNKRPYHEGSNFGKGVFAFETVGEDELKHLHMKPKNTINLADVDSSLSSKVVEIKSDKNNTDGYVKKIEYYGNFYQVEEVMKSFEKLGINRNSWEHKETYQDSPKCLTSISLDASSFNGRLVKALKNDFFKREGIETVSEIFPTPSINARFPEIRSAVDEINSEVRQDFIQKLKAEEKVFNEEKVFVVPCNDLESAKIIEILKNEGYEENKNYFVTNQGWGASYEKLEPLIKVKMLEATMDNKTVYTVEIANTPNSYKTIDHHGDLSNNPSSIEQVSKLVNHKMDLHETLIAKDDVGGMLNVIEYCKENNVSDVDAKNIALAIRKEGYEYNGITQKDIELSDEAKVENNNGVTVVYLENTSKTGYICDKYIEAEKGLGLLIISYNKNENGAPIPFEINYYGSKTFSETLGEDLGLDKNEYWSGGSGKYEGKDIGFFGTCNIDKIREQINIFDEKNADKDLNEIIAEKCVEALTTMDNTDLLESDNELESKQDDNEPELNDDEINNYDEK